MKIESRKKTSTNYLFVPLVSLVNNLLNFCLDLIERHNDYMNNWFYLSVNAT